MSAPLSGLITPDEWAGRISAPPLVTSDPGLWPGVLVRRWRDTHAEMTQPPLDHHKVVLHLGGAKRVRRKGEGAEVQADVALNALTFTSAGRAHAWRTEGPIDFAHLYVDPHRLNRFAEVEFGRDNVDANLSDVVGRPDALLACVMTEMLRELTGVNAGSRLYLDGLLNVVLIKLLRDHSTFGVRHAGSHLLSPRRLRRVLDYIETNLDRDIALDDLAAAAGASAYRFGQAFRRATGSTPYAYVLDQRIGRAKRLLRDSAEPVSEIAWRCGFNSPTQFATIFKRRTGLSPRRFRQDWC